MSLELVHTSAPKGLGPASSGFCTVAATGGMSRQFMMRLEALSGYQFHFSLSDPQANQNPVNYAHTRISVGGQTHSVLSRIGFAGADYSGRTNKVAHHVMLERGEALPQGPAWMLMTQGVFIAAWNREPGNLPRRSPWTAVAGQPRPPEPATTWAAMTGDAGWGGLLAKAVRESPKTLAFVVFRPGQELLPLFEESMALLPPEERWQVCFATYYTSLATGSECHWRGILAGSPAAKELARFPNATVIDLTAPLGAAPDNPYTEAARAGRTLPPLRGPERPRIQVVERAPHPAAAVAASVGEELESAAWALEMDRSAPAVDRAAFAPAPAPPRRRSVLVPVLAATCAFLIFTNVVTLLWWNQDRVVTEAPPITGKGGTQGPEASPSPAAPPKQPTAGPVQTEVAQAPESPAGTAEGPSPERLESPVEKLPADTAGADAQDAGAAQDLATVMQDRRNLLGTQQYKQTMQEPASNANGEMRWEVGQARGFVFLPQGLQDFSQELSDTSPGVMRLCSSRAVPPIPIAEFRIEGTSPKRILVGKFLEKADADIRSECKRLVVEVFDDGNRCVWQCALGPLDPAAERVSLGYEPGGKAKAHGKVPVIYPWPKSMILPELASGLALELAETDRPGPCDLAVDFEGLLNLQDMVKENLRDARKNESERAKNQTIADKLKQVPDAAIKKLARQVGQPEDLALLQRDQKVGDLERDAKEYARKRDDDIKSAKGQVETLLNARRERLAKLSPLKVYDAWGRLIVQIDIIFLECKPDAILKEPWMREPG